MPRPWWARPSHDPVSNVRRTAKSLAAHPLHPHGFAVHPHREREIPSRGRPPGPAPREVLEGLALELRRRSGGPRVLERHEVGIVDAPPGQVDERGHGRLIRRAQLEARRGDAELEQRPVRPGHGTSLVIRPRRRRTSFAGRLCPPSRATRGRAVTSIGGVEERQTAHETVLVLAGRLVGEARRAGRHHRADVHGVHGARHHAAEVPDQPVELPQQERQGLQGRRPLRGPLRWAGHGGHDHHGSGQDHRPVLHRPQPRSDGQASSPSCTRTRSRSRSSTSSTRRRC